MVFLALFIGLIVIPAIEIYVVILVANAIGALPTIALLIGDALLGAILMRSQGRAVWRRFGDAVAARRIPAREVLDGALVIFGGALLIAPGFVTDIFGALLLLPPTRAVIRRQLTRHFTGRFVRGLAGARRRSRGGPGVTYEVYVDAPGAGGASGPAARGHDIEGSATEIDGELRR